MYNRTIGIFLLIKFSLGKNDIHSMSRLNIIYKINYTFIHVSKQLSPKTITYINLPQNRYIIRLIAVVLYYTEK